MEPSVINVLIAGGVLLAMVIGLGLQHYYQSKDKALEKTKYSQAQADKRSAELRPFVDLCLEAAASVTSYAMDVAQLTKLVEEERLLNDPTRTGQVLDNMYIESKRAALKKMADDLIVFHTNYQGLQARLDSDDTMEEALNNALENLFMAMPSTNLEKVSDDLKRLLLFTPSAYPWQTNYSIPTSFH